VGLTKTKRLEAKWERKLNMTITDSAGQAWRDFIDQLEEVNADVYKNLWMKAPANDPKVISEEYQQWRFLVQGAFLAGYFKGKEKLITGEN